MSALLHVGANEFFSDPNCVYFVLGLLAEAPRPLQEIIAAAFDIQCVYRPGQKQVTITDTTPAS